MRVALLLTAMLAAGASGARAATREVGEAGYASGLSAWGGHVVFNQLVPGTGLYSAAARWRLVEATGAGLRPLDVPPQPQPVSLDVGPDAAGRPALVYSRCAGHGFGTCHVHELALWQSDARPRIVRSLWRRRYSDTAPSIWRGRIAFGRTLTGVADTRIAALFVQRAPGSSRLRRLARGTVPSCPDGRCAREAGPAQTDLGPGALAMTWDLAGGNAIPQDAEEVWRIPLDGLPGTLLDSAVMAECGFGGSISFVSFHSPSIDGRRVAYLRQAGDCWATQSQFVRTGPGWRSQARHPVAGASLAYGMARDRDAYWWIRGPRHGDPNEDGGTLEPCADTPCQLMRTDRPRFRRTRVQRRPQPPVDESAR